MKSMKRIGLYWGGEGGGGVWCILKIVIAKGDKIFMCKFFLGGGAKNPRILWDVINDRFLTSYFDARKIMVYFLSWNPEN